MKLTLLLCAVLMNSPSDIAWFFLLGIGLALCALIVALVVKELVMALRDRRKELRK